MKDDMPEELLEEAIQENMDRKWKKARAMESLINRCIEDDRDWDKGSIDNHITRER